MSFAQFFLTPQTGKRLIAKALFELPQVRQALQRHTVVIVAGTTNACVALEALAYLKCGDSFDPSSFFRGIVRPPRAAQTLEGDVVLVKGEWMRGRTIEDIAPSLGPGDLILKGANAVDLKTGEAAVLIGNPTLGTMGPILQAVVGKRASLLMPVGVEKRVDGPMAQLAAQAAASASLGLRLLPVPGQVYTELDAFSSLFGLHARLMAAGGVGGFEGGCRFLVEGEDAALVAAQALLKELAGLPSIPY